MSTWREAGGRGLAEGLRRGRCQAQCGGGDPRLQMWAPPHPLGLPEHQQLGLYITGKKPSQVPDSGAI